MSYEDKVWQRVSDAEEWIEDSIDRFEALEGIISSTLDHYSDHDMLVDENKKMAKFLEKQGFNVDDVVNFLYKSDNKL